MDCSANRSKPPSTVQTRVIWLPAIFVAAVTVIAFLPILRNGFVEWDDYENLISNAHYRGLGWAQLSWMVTTFHMGPYQPLSWMTYGLDYLLWGMKPAGYHLTSLLFHAANAVFFYFVCRRILGIIWPNEPAHAPWHLSTAAAFAALFFSIHPLRVESVAWATERRDVVSGFFFLATVYCYLRATSKVEAKSVRWLSAAFFCYVLSLLGKATAIALPIVLLILDIFPLRRLEGAPRTWWATPSREIVREKLLFVLPAILFAIIAFLGQRHASAIKSLAAFGFESRVVQALFAAGFYIWKTIVPVNLSPLYEIPPDFSLWDPVVLSGVALSVGFSVIVFVLRRRWPAGLACWFYSLAMLAPVLGIVSTGPQLAADRYTYLPFLSWALLAGAGFLFITRSSNRARPLLAAYLVVILIVSVFGVLTWRQTAVWRDTGTLWSHVLKVNPNSSIAHYNFAKFLANTGQRHAAMAHYRDALKIRPDDAEAHNNLGLLLAIEGRTEESIKEFQTAIKINPGYERAFFNLGRVYARAGELQQAVENYRQAAILNPNQAEIRLGLGNALAQQGSLEAAAAEFEVATKLSPDLVDARTALAGSLAALGRKEEAEKQYLKAKELLLKSKTLGEISRR
jgi:protein O-mannosyl-transferase